MLGPVFWLELLRTVRRGQHRRLRNLLFLALLGEAAVFLLVLFSTMHPLLSPRVTGSSPEAVGGLLTVGLQWLVLQQLVVLLLVVPAQAAGSLGDEKETGTLLHLLGTPLESRHIIVGKWLALIVEIAVLGLPAVPFVLLLAGHVGMSGREQAALVIFPLVPLPALVAGSLLASVWARRTSTAVVAVYVLLAAIGLGGWLTGLADPLGPGGVIAACLAGDGTVWRELGWFGLAWSAPVLPCLVLASWRLRPAYRKQLPGETRAGLRGAAWRPPVGRQPLRWKERYLGERSLLPLPAALGRPVRLTLVAALTALVYGGLVVAEWRGNPSAVVPSGVVVLMLGLGVGVLAALLVAVRCAGSVSAERERQTWETLLLTPLEPRHLLRGKLWGVLDAARSYLVTYLAVAGPLALLLGPDALFWLVLTWLATWIAMYFTAATGLECSVRAGNSWRALARALLSSGWVALQRFVLFGVPIGFGGGMLASALPLTGWGRRFDLAFVYGFALGSLVATVAVLLARAEAHLEQAERHLESAERIAQGGERFRLEEGAARQRSPAWARAREL